MTIDGEIRNKKHNTMSIETQKQYQRYNQAKLIYENILQAKNTTL